MVIKKSDPNYEFFLEKLLQKLNCIEKLFKTCPRLETHIYRLEQAKGSLSALAEDVIRENRCRNA